MKTKNLIILLIILTGLSATILSFNIPQQKADGFKNLKVLPKTITKKQLDSTMSYYSLSLGVRCGFCHAKFSDTTNHHLDFASDAKDEKKIAREMMIMTAGLNTNNFNYFHSPVTDTIHMVTCYTCHRGKEEPSAKNLLPEVKAIREKMEKDRSPQRKKD